MEEGRDLLLRVWGLAEGLAAQEDKPFHAFLLLYHVLTQPPLALRRVMGGTTAGGDAAAETPKAVLPLHTHAFDAEWKAEELVTRLRAAELLLLTDAPAPPATTAGAAPAPPPRLLSRVAGLEAAELAEQVLAPIFAVSSLTSTTTAASSSSDTAVAANGGRRGSASYSLEEVLQDAMEVRRSSAASTTTTTTTAAGAVAADALGWNGGLQSRAASMCFLSHAVVTALTWPTGPFTLAWPIADDKDDDDAIGDGDQAMHAPGEVCGGRDDGHRDGRSAVPQLSFGPASETIMISVSLVVRAHVLQAAVCHRRAQYARALQCLAEARQWIALQFSAAARARSVRLLWEDLQQRWVTAPSCAAAPALPCPSQFHALMEQLIEGEGRACAALVQVEECRMHYAVVHAGGSLQTPLPLALRHPGAAPPVHTGDLRLHLRRHHESLERLHSVSHGYMTVVRWIEAEAAGEDACTAASSMTPSQRCDVLRSVRRQLNPHCLSALRYSSSGAAVEESPCYVESFHLGLAAEVLGVYHCLSHVHFLCQQSATTLGTATTPSSTQSTPDAAMSAVAFMARGERARRSDGDGDSSNETMEDVETAFLRRYHKDPGYHAFCSDRHLPPQQQQQQVDASSDASVPNVGAITGDAVRRAVEHVKVNAFLFGRRLTTLAPPPPTPPWRETQQQSRSKPLSGGGDGGSAAHKPNGCPTPPPTRLVDSPRHPWRASADAVPGAAGDAAHEAVLLWCLTEMGFCDNYPLALRLQREMSSAVPNADAPPPPQPKDEDEEGEKPREQTQQRKRRRSSSSSPSSSSEEEEVEAWRPRSCLAPPYSWSWVLPGVRRVLQLNVELATALMHAAATTATTTTTATHGATEARGAAAAAAPLVPIVRIGLQNAEKVMARFLFAVDAEMLQLSSHTWGIPSSSSSSSPGARHGDSDDAVLHERRRALLDRLHCPAPAQLRFLVQMKAAALLTMARHHLTQLSLGRAVHYLREGQQFARVFHRQVRVALLPEMHMLLACVATCASLRRLPEPPAASATEKQRDGSLEGNNSSSSSSVSSGDGDAAGAYGRSSATRTGALCALAQGWPSAETRVAAAHVNRHSSGDGEAARFSILPEEEATVAQDVGLPYLHLLAAERAAAAAALHTPPSLSLLLYLLKAWAVFQFVLAGDEVAWPRPCSAAAPAPLTVVPRSPGMRSTSQSPQVMPLPSPSHATTTLNTTVEDQQRRVARLDSVTTTPTSTPTLRSRHAMLPTEMQRIQLEPATAAARVTPLAVKREEEEEDEEEDGGGGGGGRRSPVVKVEKKNGGVSAGGAAAAAAPRLQLGPSIVVGHCTALAEVRPVPRTQQHRAADVLQRMMDVLLHHYEGRGAAWTPHNTILFRLLRGAVLLCEDKDEPAAARELKEGTHFAKRHLGVLHPSVADGLALLANAYASLDIDVGPNGDARGCGTGDVDSCSRLAVSTAQLQRPAATADGGGVARTRRVAVQLAMRCSCTALASLATTTSAYSSGDGTDAPAAAAAADALTSPSVIAVRLREWWRSQVLHDLCGSGGAHQQLRSVFGWLPGAEDYVHL
ncbi:hypothetical protein NESM_000824100 [Novymonas esmeraldas]|uniref:Separase n=1 Tax=Novymonas esmeraldas TaxID=1808958 RepID=A0AAW0EWB4_9TRYP